MNSMPVLDYASPAAKTKFRVGSQSVVRMSRTPSELRISETLEEHGPAIGALIFSSIPVGFLCVLTIISVWGRPDEWPIVFATAVIFLPWLITALAVIDSNWRRTMLEVSRERITLSMFSPLRRARIYMWPPSNLRSVQLLARGNFLFEIVLVFREQEVRLFTGHRMHELIDIDRAIRTELETAEPVEAVS